MIIIRWVLFVLALVLASYATRLLGFQFNVDISSFRAILLLFLGAGTLAILNGTLGKLLKLLTLPFSCLTLGLFSFVINALILFLTSRLFHFGFYVETFGAALVGSIFLSVANSILNLLMIHE
jgi:putative membrane protein